MQGATDAIALSPMATLGAPLINTSRRQAYVPVRLECQPGQLVAWPLPSKGSADAVTHARANALVILDAERREAAAGDRVPLFALESLLERHLDPPEDPGKAPTPICTNAKGS
jgi:molybdopterin biosynthesis enzyme